MQMTPKQNAIHRELWARVRHAENELNVAIRQEGAGPESSFVKYLRRLYLAELKNKCDTLDRFSAEYTKYIASRRSR